MLSTALQNWPCPCTQNLAGGFGFNNGENKIVLEFSRLTSLRGRVSLMILVNKMGLEPIKT